MARNLATPADACVLLNFHKGANLRLVPDLAAVEVDERRKLDILPQLHIWGNAEILVHESRWRCQQAPFPAITAPGVASRIFTSFQSEQLRTYRRSRRTISSNVVRLRPSTCHNPVMPGLASSTRRQCQGLYWSTSYWSGGRGPTSDIVPHSTFQSCGSSSRLVFRRKRPIGVIRGSLVNLKTEVPLAAALDTGCAPPLMN